MKNKEKNQKMMIMFFSTLMIIYAILCILSDLSLIAFDIEKYIPATYAVIFMGILSGVSISRENKDK